MPPQAHLLISKEHGNPLQTLSRAARYVIGQRWNCEGARFEILHLQADVHLQKAMSNPMSCLLSISNGARTALLVGNIERRQEERLFASGEDLQAGMLLAPQ